MDGSKWLVGWQLRSTKTVCHRRMAYAGYAPRGSTIDLKKFSQLFADTELVVNSSFELREIPFSLKSCDEWVWSSTIS